MNHPASCELACCVVTFLRILHVISFYYIDTDEIPGFFHLLKIISSPRAVKILFLSFTCEDMVLPWLLI